MELPCSGHNFLQTGQFHQQTIAHGVSSSISSVMTSMIAKVGRSEKQVG